MFLKKVGIAVTAAVVAAGAIAGVAYATIPDGSGVIHACYTKSSGALRVIDSSVTNCSSKPRSTDGLWW